MGGFEDGSTYAGDTLNIMSAHIRTCAFHSPPDAFFMGDRSVNRLGQERNITPDVRVTHIECAGGKAMKKARLDSLGECEKHIQ